MGEGGTRKRGGAKAPRAPAPAEREAYIERKIEEAIAPLTGLGAKELERVRTLLRAKFEEEPELAALVEVALTDRPPRG